jgi:hypothetical protein
MVTAMDYVEVNLENGIRWPLKCAHCNGSASAEARTHFRVIDGFFLVAIRETTHTVNYPVCARHKWIAKFYGFMTNQAWPTGFVMVLILPPLLLLLLGVAIGFKVSDLAVVIAYIVSIAWVYYLKMHNPVKIMKATKALAKVRLSNRQYADAFRRANSAAGAGPAN